MKYDLMEMQSIAKRLNNRMFTDYFYRLMLISRSLFEWENLPNGIDEKWIERFLFTEGSCIFYKDPEMGFMVAKMGLRGNLNCYSEPTGVYPIAPNYVYTGEDLTNNVNAVIIRNNDEMIPTLPTIELYSFKLANIDRTIDVNIQNQKTPLIVKCSDKQKLTLKQAIKQRDENEFVIYGDKNLDLTGVSVLNTNSPVVFDKLQIQKNYVWNECMTFLGVNNANMDKRERLVTDEVSANNEQVKASEDVMLKAREHACKLINNMFGLDIRVKRRNLSEVVIEENKMEGNIEDEVIMDA